MHWFLMMKQSIQRKIDSCIMNGERYVTIPRNLWNSLLFCGAGISLTHTRNLVELLLTSHFSLFSTSLCSLATYMNLFRVLSCFTSSLPCMIISSAILITPSQWSMIWCIILWKVSCTHASLNGRCVCAEGCQKRWFIVKNYAMVRSI